MGRCASQEQTPYASAALASTESREPSRGPAGMPFALLHNLLLAPGNRTCHSAAFSLRWSTLRKRKRTKFGKDKRRKHRHWQVTVYYQDGEKFARVYTDRSKATRFAERQKKSPVVKATRVMQLG